MTNAITNAASLEQVVEIINANEGSEYFGGTDLRSAEQMAGQYAWEAASESGYTDDQSIEGQLEILADAGAMFDFNEALKEAVALKKQ